MKKAFILLITIALFVACSTIKYEEMPTNKRMQIANDFFKQEKYKKAANIYKTIVFERHSSLTPEAQFKLAECYFKDDNFEDAQFEYNEMIRLFPDYSNIGESYYKLGICFQEQSLNANYTQEETLKAIETLELYIDKFRSGKNKVDAIKRIKKLRYKLLEKKFINGLTYYRINDYSSALMYFDEIINLGNKNELELKSLYWSFRIYLYRKNFEKAKKTLDTLKTDFKGKELVLDAEKRYKQESN